MLMVNIKSLLTRTLSFQASFIWSNLLKAGGSIWSVKFKYPLPSRNALHAHRPQSSMASPFAAMGNAHRCKSLAPPSLSAGPTLIKGPYLGPCLDIPLQLPSSSPIFHLGLGHKATRNRTADLRPPPADPTCSTPDRIIARPPMTTTFPPELERGR